MRATGKWAIVSLALVLALPGRGGAKDLGDLLVERGIISQKDLDELRKQADATPGVAAAAAPTPSVAPAGVAPAVVAVPSQPGAPSLDAVVKDEVQRQLPDWLGHFSLSTMIFMDYAYYLTTGYGPQFLENITPPGPGNDGFNSFDLTRAYINFVWNPSDRFTIRITPDVYRAIDINEASNTSQSSQVSTNVNGSLQYRLKYGFLQANNLLDLINPDLPELNLRVGQMESPLIPWEENLYGYRFVNLVPLNFLAYSSADLGVALLGPVKVNGIRYADYWLGVYNGSTYHTAEFNENRSPQGRVSVYPLAALPGFEDLGLSYFMSYGYTNVAPDTEDAVVRRMATLLHYSGKYGALAFEYDRTRNENSFNTFFSGAAPKQMIPDPNNPGEMIVNPVYTLYNSILNPAAIGQGFNLFGHVNVMDYPVSVFGMWQRWYPNLDINPDPLDFDRFVFGVEWSIESWLRVAVDSQNLVYLHSGPNVPQSTNAVFTNLEINY